VRCEMSEVAKEVAYTKTGMELFRELLRIYPVAEVADYYKAGVWRNEIMKMDFLLILAHRSEGGAPEPPPLEQIPVPQLPKAKGLAIPGLKGAGVQVPIRPGMASPKPVVAKAVAGAMGRSPEMRLTALFVAKHRLDPSKAKSMLTALEPHERRAVLVGFKATVPAVEATDELDKYIKKCKASGDWKGSRTLPGPVAKASTLLGLVTAGAAAGAGANGTPAAPGKRPAGEERPPEDAKRPRVVAPASKGTPHPPGPLSKAKGAEATEPGDGRNGLRPGSLVARLAGWV